MDKTKKRRVAIVAGTRTAFVKAGTAFKELGPLQLARQSVVGLIERHHVDPDGIQAIAEALKAGVRTRDLGGSATTTEFTDRVLQELD